MDAKCCDMVQIKTPDLGSIHNAIEAVLYCHSHGVEAYLGGTCNETDVSARACLHIAQATRLSGCDQARNGFRRGFDDRFKRDAPEPDHPPSQIRDCRSGTRTSKCTTLTTPNPIRVCLSSRSSRPWQRPLCSCHFAEGGARVIKIERPEGDFARKYDKAVKGESSYFVWANHGKESLCLDIKDKADAELLHQLLSRADIFIQNLVRGPAPALGLTVPIARAAILG